MRKKILLSSVLAASAAMLCIARPIRGASAASSEEFPDIELPYDAEVEYLESTGTQYIVLPITFNPSDSVDAIFSLKQSTYDKYMVSTRPWNTPSGTRFAMGQYPQLFAGAFGSAGTSDTYLLPRTYNDRKLHLWTYSDYRFSIEDIGISCDVSSIRFNGESSPVCLFWGYNAPTKGQLCLYRHVKNNRIALWLVPVRFTNELGEPEGAMYDRVSNTLFRNQGTGSFVIGPDL